MHPSSVQGVEDMTKLGDYHESAILRNIHVRYREKLIYTYTGSILIAVNPYMDIPIYAAEQIRMYKRKKIGEDHPLGPSVLLVFLGESGAGKTESTKLVLQFLATISGQHSWIEQQVLEANPILEAFGNAKTVRNDNSSRFGKYIEVHFNVAGSIEGARIEKYLLEKSRIVSQSQGERNYHIFYCLLAGLSAEERRHLELTKASDFFYLTQGKTLEADGRDDAADLAEIRSAMKVLLFKEPEIGAIFQLLAALLHIGNVKYRGTVVDTIEGVEVSDAANIARIAKLLQVDEQKLLSTFTTRTIVTREERVVVRLSSRNAVDARDALAKGIYGRLFSYIVMRINDAIYRPRNDPAQRHSIGVLDIFGFENFETNSFEQLCINYANESLQQFFVQHIFKMEQAEYDQEQINWRQIKFVDNQETLEMIAVRPMNVFSLIDEESIFPKGTDQSMLCKLHTNHSSANFYLRPKSDLQRAFGVRHFAGPVYYNTKGFLEKNRDAFSADLHSLVQSSRMHLLLRIFDVNDYSDGTSRGKGGTVSSQFRKSLDQLMQQLNQTEPFFIRCIKPNEFKRPMMMDRGLVLRQLQYSGMLETIKIRRNGYPIRHDFEPFVRRYRVLVNGIGASPGLDVRVAAEMICTKVLGHSPEFQLGRTKVFLKEKHDLYLEQEYHRMLSFRATVIQKHVKGWVVRRTFKKQKEAATVIQKHWRRYVQQKRYSQITSGFCRLQAVLRSRQLVLHYQSLRRNIINFQAACRGALVRARIEELKKNGGRRIPPQEIAREEAKEDIKEEELVGQLFDFLPPDSRMDTIPDSVSTSDFTMDPKPSVTVAPDSEDFGKYQFSKFAATYFQPQCSASHRKSPLKTPLLSHEDSGTQLAAMAVWITILRFMGDLPDVKPMTPNGEVSDKTPVMTRLFETLGRKYTARDVEEAAHADEFDASGRTLKKSKGKKLISMTLKRKSKLSGMSSSSSDRSVESTSSSNALMETRPLSSLDKLHYIIGMGILREELRDEIYCQLCKQLTANPSRLSAARGWILMSLCIGCFAPSPREDPISTNLIYQQVVRGIRYGEYRCDKEDDLASLAAQQYYIEEGLLDVNRLESQLHNYLPDFELNGKELAKERWIQIIMYHYRRKFGLNPPSPHHVKEDVVSFAKFKWPLLFSRFYEVTKFSGPPLPRNDVIVAVNWTGIYVVDDQEQVAEDVTDLVTTFIDGLKQRSRYVIATKVQKGNDAANLLDFEVGDLIVLMGNVTGKDLINERTVKGECARTCLQGLIQTENVYVLPTLVKPNVNTLQLFSKGEQMALDILNNNNQVVVFQNHGRPHTLEQFALSNFKWRFGREPLELPLLKKLEGRDEQCRDAVSMFICVLQFLKSRPQPIAHDCLLRIMKMNRGLSRKFPPHLVEVEAIQQKTTQIYHKVYFPDQSDEAIEVESSTRAREFCQRIAQRLALKKRDGFSLFVKIKEKVLAVPENEFFFDFVRQLSDWVQNNHALKENSIIPVNYQVFFMRKLWMNVKPGDDKNADLIFHYQQECPKYLLGYHKVSKQEAVEMGSIILRAITKDSKNAPLAQIPQLLSELMISSAYTKVEHLSSDQAKIEFLTKLSKKDSFGSAFFPVSQYSDLNLPDKLLIAINQKVPVQRDLQLD
ncbi:unnamed protein product [Nippostrongylus brasiliensis]|uniref:Unconventional myosin heavy chain 6 (inferred by orthology to a C. elegans protein) n=2 Tax=Nippostrongylus brasiliensis TaxID=27835 RepID=A0A0N4XUX1_NIPBR|nr:unnamed protein product [Nippostrongylus brasiliensis]